MSNPNTPPPYGLGPLTIEWLIENVEILKRRVNGISGGGGSGSGMVIGDAVSGAGANRVLFTDASGDLSQSANFTYAGGTLTIAADGQTLLATNVDGSEQMSISVASDQCVLVYTNLNSGEETTFNLHSGGTTNATMPTGVGTLAYQEYIDDQKGQPNGLATLNGGGIVPTDQLPYSTQTYKGAWNANTNTPTLAAGAGTAGDMYIVQTAGTQDLGNGSTAFSVGNAVVYNGATWDRIGSVITATVTSVTSSDITTATVANTTSTPVITIVSAPILQTARNINHIPFNGSADIFLRPPFNNQTGTTYTFVLTDRFSTVTADNSSTQIYTVPPNASVAFTVGDRIDLIQYGTGTVTIAAGSGVTVNSFQGKVNLAGQHAAISLIKRATNTWQLIGNLA